MPAELVSEASLLQAACRSSERHTYGEEEHLAPVECDLGLGANWGLDLRTTAILHHPCGHD